jgi:hypothetical protein
MRPIEELFDRLWRDYAAIAPQAERIHALLRGRGETIVNDHIALRTFALPGLGIDVLARAFVEAGYRAGGEYEFPAKKLAARHYEHDNPSLPKVFISELWVERFSPALQQGVAALAAQVPPGAAERWDFVVSGRPWRPTVAVYEALRAESEYAAWLGAFGYRANHFTVSCNELRTFASLAELNRFLREQGFALSDAGGEIKGSPEALLEQSSTLADEIEVELADGVLRVPSCYYEFARRYPLPDGRLYQGFVTSSADKLFESTDPR